MRHWTDWSLRFECPAAYHHGISRGHVRRSCFVTDVTAERSSRLSRLVVSSSLEGTWSIFAELQATVLSMSYAMPKRKVQGIELNRVSRLLAVMEIRPGMHLSIQGIYVNIGGGMYIDEPSIGLGIAVPGTLSLREVPIESRLLGLSQEGFGSAVPQCVRLKKRATS